MKIEVKFWVGMDVAQPMWLPHFPANGHFRAKTQVWAKIYLHHYSLILTHISLYGLIFPSYHKDIVRRPQNLKKSPSCFDVYLVNQLICQNKREIFSNFCGLFRKAELQSKSKSRSSKYSVFSDIWLSINHLVHENDKKNVKDCKDFKQALGKLDFLFHSKEQICNCVTENSFTACFIRTYPRAAFCIES